MKFRDYDKYEVYDDGRIWSYSHKKFLKPAINKDGYQRVCLYDNEGKGKMYFVHRIVWEAVTREPIPNNLQINHISEVKTENMINNLELMSPKDNTNFGTRNSRVSKAKINGKTSKQVGAYRNGELIFTFPSANEAGRQGFNSGNVSACCRNCFNKPGNNKYKGYEWRYL